MRQRPRVWLVHGIHAREGRSNVRRLVPYFQDAGFDVQVYEYGWVSVLGARWRNPGIARRLAALVEPEDHVVCHSNGAAVVWLAMRDHAMRCTMLSQIAPALDSDAWSRNAIWTDVYHNAADHVVWAARWLWWHAWGSMGRDGCTDPMAYAYGYSNIDTANHAALPRIEGHLAYFDDDILPEFGRYLAGRHVRRL